MKNGYLPEGILNAMETLAEATRPYQAAMDALQHNKTMVSALRDPLVSKFSVLDSALTRGIFDENLSKSISGLLAPYHELIGVQETIKALGTSLNGLIQPDKYALANTMAATMAELAKPLEDYKMMPHWGLTPLRNC